MQSKSEEALA